MGLKNLIGGFIGAGLFALFRIMPVGVKEAQTIDNFGGFFYVSGLQAFRLGEYWASFFIVLIGFLLGFLIHFAFRLASTNVGSDSVLTSNKQNDK